MNKKQRKEKENCCQSVHIVQNSLRKWIQTEILIRLSSFSFFSKPQQKGHCFEFTFISLDKINTAAAGITIYRNWRSFLKKCFSNVFFMNTLVVITFIYMHLSNLTCNVDHQNRKKVTKIIRFLEFDVLKW